MAEDDEGERRRESARRYKLRNKKRIAEYGKRYREEHRAERVEYTKRYRAEHADQIAEYRRRWREENLEQARAANREYMRRKAAEPRIAEERRAKKAAYSRERYHVDIEASRAKARERNAQRRAADPEGYREERRRRKQAWRDRNRDEINARLRERNRVDPSKKQAAAQRYYERHAEERRAYSRRYHQEHREQQLAKQRQWRQRERRRIEAGLPVRRLHRATAAEDPSGWSEWLEDPIKALGNLVRAGIVGYLRQHGPATRGQIAIALELPAPTVAKALQAMIEAGLLQADPPPDSARRGQRIRYTVDDEVVSRMYLQLGQAIGEI